jgi:hypothetical protein
MERSEIVNSIGKGNWVEDNVLTKTKNNNSDLDIYKDIIEDYSRKRDNDIFGLDDNISELQHGTDVLAYELKSNNPISQKIKPTLDFPNLNITKYHGISKKFYKKVQNWQGIVLGIDDFHFKAKLIDITNGGTYEIAEFDIEDVSPEDRSLIGLGSLFYWSVGRAMENGQSVNRSDIRFQRLITLDESELDKISDDADVLFSNLKEKIY